LPLAWCPPCSFQERPQAPIILRVPAASVNSLWGTDGSAQAKELRHSDLV